MKMLRIPLFGGGFVEAEILQEVSLYQVMLTPDAAETILETSNVGNRPLNNERVNLYAGQMQRGTWDTENRQPLQIYESGKVKDAQHRTKAVVRSGKPQKMWVTYGVPDSSKVADLGRSRSATDILKLMGVSSELSRKNVVSCVRARFDYIAGDNQPAIDLIYKYISDNSKELVTAETIARIGGGDKYCRCASINFAIYAALKCGVPEEDLRDFAGVVNTGIPCAQRDSTSALKFREYRNDHRDKGYIERKNTAYIACDAIKHFCAGVSRKKAYTSPNATGYIDLLAKIEKCEKA